MILERHTQHRLLNPPALKICGLRRIDQALANAALGVEAIGVIGVPASPRFLEPEARSALFRQLAGSHPSCQGVLVVADPQDSELPALEASQGHRVLQLHGDETPERCARLRSQLGLTVWKALRIRRPEDLASASRYAGAVDALLLDAWVADQLGGTGHRLPLEWLHDFAPPLPWWLAGGITPERIPEILAGVQPHGLDVSSGVEESPGLKNMERVRQLVAAVRVPQAEP